MPSQMQQSRHLFLYLVGYCAIFIIVGFCLNTVAPDVAQNVAWSHSWSWGYSEHPPLVAVWYRLLLDVIPSIRLVTLLSSALWLSVAFWYAYKLAIHFISARAALVAVVLTTMCLSYAFNFAIIFNQNTAMLTFWAISAYYFYLAMRDNKWRDWIILGVVAALAMLAKYESAIILLAEIIYLLRYFKRQYLTRVIAAFIIFIVLLIPHILWLFRTDFLPFQYAYGEIARGSNNFIVRHLVYPLNALGVQAGNLAMIIIVTGSIFIWQHLVRKRFTQNSSSSGLSSPSSSGLYSSSSRGLTTGSSYLSFLAFAPIIIMILISAIWGAKMKSGWGFPVWLYLVPGIFYLFKKLIPEVRLYKLFIAGWAVQLLTMIAYVVHSATVPHPTWVNYPHKSLVKSATAFWQKHEGNKPIRYAGGLGFGIGYYLPAYLPSKPAYLSWASLKHSPWINANKFKLDGALIVYRGCSDTFPMAVRKSGFTIVARKCTKLSLLNKSKMRLLPVTLAVLIEASHSTA